MAVNKTPGWLAAEIEKRGGFISIHDYMETCLYHPEHGYYSRGENFTQPGGKDFTTAPLLTPLFGACVAHWVQAAWRRIGSPQACVLAEAGPGNGDLIYFVLNNLPKDIILKCEVLMVETSPALTRLQQQKLSGFNVRWQAELTPQSLPVILFGNEVLDAFPVRQFIFETGAWHERGFDEQLQPTTRPATPALPAGFKAVEGAVFECSEAQSRWLERVKENTAAALLVDYGYMEGHGDSVQAMQAHRPVALTHGPGRSDITAHVNFAHVAGTLGKGCTIADMAPFLLAHGLLAAAEPTINDENTAAALHRLLHPTRMGALFKVAEYFA